MTLYGVGNAIRAALRDDADILARCQSLFGKAHAVYQGSAGTKAPLEDDFPVFTVLGEAKDRGEEMEDRTLQFTIGLILEDETATEATAANGVKTVVYRGAQSLEELLDLAMDAIRAINTEIFFDGKTTVLEPLEFFPIFVGELDLEVTYPTLIGGYEPTI